MKSALRRIVEESFADEKRSLDLDLKICTPEEANEVCSLMEEYDADPKKAARLLTLFQSLDEEAEEAIEILRIRGTPLLLELEPKLPNGSGGFGDERMFLLKLLAMYGTVEGADRIISVAKAGYSPDGYLWSIVLRCFTPEHPEASRVLAALSSPLPTNFMAVSLLDAANHCAITGLEFEHPFDSLEGTELLRQWLRNIDPERFSYAHSATAALPFISNPPRNELLQLAMDHPDPGVSVEAAWAAARIGMERGIRELTRFASQVNTSAAAIRLLTELNREDAIPAEARDPDFIAMSEAVDWLSHPNEFGEPPSKISLYDTRELFWPSTNDRRRVWLFKYEYSKTEQRVEDDIGLAMVGSITFALFGEVTANLSPMDAYAIHCCWELETNKDSRAPKKRSTEAGLKILAEFNDLSFES